MEGQEMVGKIILSVMFGLPLLLIAMGGVSKDWNRLCVNCCRKKRNGVPTSTFSNIVCKFYHCKGSSA